MGDTRGEPACELKTLTEGDVEELLALRLRNRNFFTPFEPRRADPDAGYTRDSLLEMITINEEARTRGLGYAFGVFAEGTLVGRVTLSNVVRAAWQSCTLGYYIDQSMCGRGYGTEAVKQIVAFAFGDAELHRVQAAVMPRNVPSARVLEKAGFRHEGFAPRYLQIDGVWEDHDLYAITAD